MSIDQTQKELDSFADQSYKYGFETIIESDRPEKGLNIDIIKKLMIYDACLYS